MNFFQLNKLSELHNGKNIFFCKTDFLEQDFKLIRSINNSVILITGNSDYPIDESIIKKMPENINHWFAQNLKVFNDKIHPIPLGIENRYESIRNGHGIGYDRVETKENVLNNINKIEPSKLVYANFDTNTNLSIRNEIKDICKSSKFIDWENPTLSIDIFFKKIMEYESVVCPAGNGIDTHRLWETLYLGRIPITVKVGEYKIYELYEKLPIIILNNSQELLDETLIKNKIKNIKENSFQKSYLDILFWKNLITEISKKI